MNTSIILWIWPVLILGSAALYGILLTRGDDVSRDKEIHNPAE